MKAMKLFRNSAIALLAIASLFSCKITEDPVFEKSATVRLNEAMDNAAKVLTSPANGWVMYYYPEGNRIYGGYTYVMQFDGKNVTVGGELFPEMATSLYSITNDSGPVLSFDTNNHVFHYFATPSGSTSNLYGESGMYQGYKGDFEFIIMKATDEEVILRGKRTGNHIVMKPLAESMHSYLNKVVKMSEDVFVSNFDGKAGSDAVNIYLSLGDRQATVSLPDVKDENGNALSKKVAYIFTDTGLQFYDDVVLNGHTFNVFTFDSATKSLVADGVTYKGSLPAGWHNYQDFIGNYSLVYKDGDATMTGISISELVNGKTFVVSGLSRQFDVLGTYDLGLGRMMIQAQYVGVEGDYRVMMAACDYNADKVQYTTGGMYGILSDDGTEMSWVNNQLWSGRTCDAFILYYFTAAGTRVGFASAPWVFSNDSNECWGWQKFVRQ